MTLLNKSFKIKKNKTHSFMTEIVKRGKQFEIENYIDIKRGNQWVG